MVEIILLWHVHPNENPVTREMAKRLKRALKKREHTVQIIEAPEEYRYRRHLTDPSRDHFGTKGDGWGFELRKRFPDSSIIELHVSPEGIMFGGKNPANPRKISGWKAAHIPKMDMGLKVVAPLELMTNNPGWHVLETPAKYRKAVPGFRTGKEKAFLKASKAANYLSPTVIKKVAHLVDTVVNTEQGVYHKPRRPPHRKSKLPRPQRKTKRPY